PIHRSRRKQGRWARLPSDTPTGRRLPARLTRPVPDHETLLPPALRLTLRRLEWGSGSEFVSGAIAGVTAPHAEHGCSLRSASPCDRLTARVRRTLRSAASGVHSRRAARQLQRFVRRRVRGRSQSQVCLPPYSRAGTAVQARIIPSRLRATTRRLCW